MLADDSTESVFAFYARTRSLINIIVSTEHNQNSRTRYHVVPPRVSRGSSDSLFSLAQSRRMNGKRCPGTVWVNELSVISVFIIRRNSNYPSKEEQHSCQYVTNMCAFYIIVYISLSYIVFVLLLLYPQCYMYAYVN